MAIAINILLEEKKNLEMQLERIQNEIKALPEGSIRYKSIRGRSYAYRQYRERGTQKMVSVAIKKNEDILSITNQMDRRKYLIQKARQLSTEIKLLERSIKVMKG